MAAGSELEEIKGEIREVKQALRSGQPFLGMTDQTLQKYFVQLNEKELLLLKQVDMSQSRGNGGAGGGGYLAESAVATKATPHAPQGAAAATTTTLQARALPEGPSRAFDKEDLASVLTHMTDYEGSAQESMKALRALSPLAYANAKLVGEDKNVVDQTLRLMDLHRGEDAVVLAAMRALCNMAYSPMVATGRLAQPEVLGLLLTIGARPADGAAGKEISSKVSEAAARIVAAELEEAMAPGATSMTSEKGPLAGYFAAAANAEASGQEVASKLLAQFIASEVVEPQIVAKRFVVAAKVICQGTGKAAAGWLEFSKLLANFSCAEVPPALVESKALGAAVSIMEAHASNGAVQLGAIEAMSAMVGNRWAALVAFANAKGILQIETAMRAHSGETLLQTKGIRALASGLQWPAEVQDKSCFSSKRSAEITMTAMKTHMENAELQSAGLEALSKYINANGCKDVIKANKELIEASVDRHKDQQKVQSFGKTVLDAIAKM